MKNKFRGLAQLGRVTSTNKICRRGVIGKHFSYADVVELAYTCGLSPHAARIEGSTPSISTIK